MVRTRQSGSIEDNESSELILLEAQRRQRSIHDLQDDDDSILSGYIPPRKRRRGPRLTRSSVQHKTTNSTRSSLRRCTRKIKEEDDDDDDDDAEDEEEEEEEIVKIDSMPKANGLVNGIRRSTRQRKVVYDTLNQSWILGTKNRDFPNFEDSMESGKFGKLQNQEDGDYVDMYTRVKRQSRKAVRNLYGMNKNKKDSDDDTDDSGGDGEFEDGMDDLQQSRLRPENDQWDTKSSEEDTQDETTAHPKYYLRQKKPIINRFQVPIEPIRTRKVTSKSVFHTSPPRRRNKKFRVFRSPAHKSPLFQRRRHATHNSSTSSSSSSSSSSEDEHRFERRKAKSMAKARSRCMPMNFATEELTKGLVGERVRIGSSLADVDPMNINRSITFDCVGGLSKHVEALKEMILFPLMYPEVFAKFSITPPRGVLFYGPPGTGKTLVARALANECSRGNDKVAFFMRKGADCLSKWVGESERQLRLLFDQAYCMRPSIIFFDEIDGLAPVRSSRQDQIHSSIVSTLLALMDGLDSRGEVVVVGATNRIDAIDPALRRPGRFDREFLFSLPSVHARKSILKIHTKDWVPQLSSAFLSEIAEKTVGYCGADLKALCAEAALFALKRRYPQIYSSREKFKLDVSSIRVEAKDFIKAMAHIVPAGQRSVTSPGRALSAVIQPLLQKSLNKVLKILSTIFPYSATLPSVNCGSDETRSNLASSESESDDEPNICIYEDGDKCNLENSPNCKLKKSNLVSTSKRLLFSRNIYHRPRLLLAGKADQGQSIHLAPAILHGLEHIPVHKLDLSTLFAVTAKAPEESCAQVFHEARRTLPSIVFLPYISRWWGTLNETVQATFLTMLNDLEPSAPLLLLATSECCYDELPLQIQQLFSTYQGEVIEMQNPSRDERHEFFLHLIMQQTVAPPRIKRKHNELEKLPVAEVPEKRVFSETELKKLEEQEENTLRELRLFLREILYKLARERRFSVFRKPVDISEVPDYLDVVQHPMDLETMMMKVDTHQYQTVDQFLKDIELISFNALEYNPDRDPSDKSIRHRACALSDAAHVLVKTELDPEFDQMCKEIYESRLKRGGPFNKFGPINYHTIPKPRRLEAGSDHPTGSNESQSTPRDTSETTKRFSRRLRGMSVPTSPTVAANNPQRKAVKPTVPPGSEIKFRRKRSYWFGSCKRRIVRRIITDDSTNDSIIPETKKDHAAGRDNQKEENVNMDKETELTSSFECDKESPKSHCSQSNHCSGISSNLQNNRSPTNSTDRFSLDDHHRPSSFSKGFSPNRSSSSFNLTPNNSPTAVNAHSDFSSVETVNSKDKPSQTNCGDCLSSNTQCHSGNAGEKVPIHNTPEPPREVTVDKDHLKWILDAIVKATDDCSVETLEKLYCVLCRCIKKHRKEWDKTNLLKELEAEIERFQRSLVS